jgi:hypothetical protein
VVGVRDAPPAVLLEVQRLVGHVLLLLPGQHRPRLSGRPGGESGDGDE